MDFRQIRQILKVNLNRARCDFGRHEFTKGELVSLASGDEGALEACLTEWAAAGYLRILIPISTAPYEAVCVETLNYIEVRIMNTGDNAGGEYL